MYQASVDTYRTLTEHLSDHVLSMNMYRARSMEVDAKINEDLGRSMRKATKIYGGRCEINEHTIEHLSNIYIYENITQGGPQHSHVNN